MTQSLQALEEDISFLKALALEGRGPALLGGSTLVAAGAFFGAASLAHGALAIGLLPTPTPWVFPILWSGTTAAFLVVLAVLKRRFRSDRAVGAGARASALAWQGVGFAIFTLAACMALVAWRAHSAVPLLMFPSMILALYGMAWTVAGAVSSVKWTGLAAGGAFGAAILAAALCNDASVFLVFAGALVLLAIVPGLALIRGARAGA